METNYLLPNKYLTRIKDIDMTTDFKSIYSKLLEIFFESFDKEVSISSDYSNSQNYGRKILLVTGKNSKAYTGTLWNDKRIKNICYLDALFTVPLWDWWINPVFPRNTFRKAEHTLIFTEDIAVEDVSDLKDILVGEGSSIKNIFSLDALEPRYETEIRCIDTMINGIWPIKLAYELKRISNYIRANDFSAYSFVLRGGQFIRDALGEEIDEAKVIYLNVKNSASVSLTDSDLVLDDCIGTTKTLERIIKTNTDKFGFATIDATLPKEVYQKKFPNIRFSLPHSYLNIYCCRLFEDNAFITGERNKKSNIVREKLLNNLKELIRVNESGTLLSIVEEKLLNTKNFN